MRMKRKKLYKVKIEAAQKEIHSKIGIKVTKTLKLLSKKMESITWQLVKDHIPPPLTNYYFDTACRSDNNSIKSLVLCQFLCNSCKLPLAYLCIKLQHLNDNTTEVMKGMNSLICKQNFNQQNNSVDLTHDNGNNGNNSDNDDDNDNDDKIKNNSTPTKTTRGYTISLVFSS